MLLQVFSDFTGALYSGIMNDIRLPPLYKYNAIAKAMVRKDSSHVQRKAPLPE